MKNFLNKVQDLGKKAAEIKQAVQGAPAKAAELREAVTMTAGELQQLRSEVQSNLNGLRANNEEHLLRAMREINDAALKFEEAGYELGGMDLDLSLTQRLSVHLKKFEDVPHGTLASLASGESRQTIRSILSGLLKAEETAANVELKYLNLDGVIVHVGAVPLIRICWRSESVGEEQVVTTVQAAASTSQPVPPVIGSFFEQRSVPAPTVISAPSVAPVPTSTPVTISPQIEKEQVPATSPWSSEALNRFKKMPDLSKHRK